jgi:tetratricopeptide (TPR) repeat protein
MMTKRRARTLFALGLAGATSSMAPARAAAQTSLATEVGPSDVELAETYAAEAFAAYRVRDYGRAVMLYERALAAAPSPDIVYNIARVYDVGLANRRLAIEYYERYVADPGAANSRIETVSQRLEELRAAERAGSGEPHDDVTAIARDFPLDVPEPEPAPPPPPALTPSRHRPVPRDVGFRPLQLGAIALGSAGLAGVAVGVSFGLAARAQTDAWRRDCDGNACVSQRGVDAAESAERRARLATMGFAAGGGLLAVAGVLWLIDADNERSGDAWALGLSPMADGSSVGGSIDGTF